MWRVCGRVRARESDREAIVPCSVQVIAVLFLDRCCLLLVCDLNPLSHPEQAMADYIWMETALIASSFAEHRDTACSWARKQGAIERDLSNETTYQELVEEIRLRPLEARRLAAFLCPEVAEVKQQRMESLANCESEKAWTPGEELDREDLKRTTVTTQEGWTVRTSRGPRRRQKMGLDRAEF